MADDEAKKAGKEWTVAGKVGVAAACVAAAAYGCYYVAQCAQRPKLYYRRCQEDDCAGICALVRRQCVPALHSRYWPTVWATNAHINTFVVSYARARPAADEVSYLRLELALDSDAAGRVYVDWAVPAEYSSSVAPARSLRESNAELSELLFGRLPDAAATLLICSGLNGGSSSLYVMQLARLALGRGWAVCCLNNRGANSTPLHSSRTYCGAYTDDIRLAVEHIARRRPRAAIVAVGFSLGANMLTKYVAEQCRERRAPCPAAVVVVSNPWNFALACQALRQLPLYDSVMAQGLVRSFAMNYRSVGWDSHPELDIEAILQRTRSVYDFDEQVTRRVWGYASVEDYYRDASSDGYLPHVAVPLLAINALDDPMIPVAAIPFQHFERNANLLLATTPCGGHVGFAEGWLPVGDVASWAERVAVDFLDAVLSGQKVGSAQV